MRLSELATDQEAVITAVEGSGAFRKRIIEMGFVRGKVVRSLKNAPLNDPIEYKIMDYHVSLRREEAKMVVIAPLSAHESDDYVAFDTKDDGQFRAVSGMVQKGRPTIKIALVGNPNSGKTTIFNYLSGKNEHTGNYSGVTIGASSVTYKYKDYNFELVDLPGTNSVSPYSPEELFVRNTLLSYDPDIVLNVVDAANLARNFYLTTQLIDMGQRMVCALNMYDDFERSGDKLNYVQLGRMLGMPMVPTVGSKGRGLEDLQEKIIAVYEGSENYVRRIRINYGNQTEETLSQMQATIEQECQLPATVASRYLALKVLENDMDFAWDYVKCADQSAMINKLTEMRYELTDRMQMADLETYLTDSRYGFIDGALGEVYQPAKRARNDRQSSIDKILTHKFLGIPFFILFMWIMFECTFSIGQYPMDWIESGVDMLCEWLTEIMPEGPVKDLVIDGVIQGVGGVIVFLPNILILFLFISFMEDTGYLARAAFIMDRLMHKMGLHGKSFIPLVMGFGCNVPAVMSTRTIEDRGNRMLTMLIVPFMSCSARLPVYILFCSAFFPDSAGLVMLGIYVIGIVMSIVACKLYKATIVTSKELPFVMELPPYRMPTLRSTLVNMWSRASQYLSKMAGIILVASIIIWFLGYYPQNELFEQQRDAAIEQAETDYADDEDALEEVCAQIEQDYLSQCQEFSLIGRIGMLIAPENRPLSYDWKMGVSLIAGVAAKEIVISSLAVLYSTDEENEEGLVARLQNEMRDGEPFFNQANVMSYMVFTLLYFPCMAALVAIKNEAAYGSEMNRRRRRSPWRWPILVAVANTIFAWIAAWIVYHVMMYIG